VAASEKLALQFVVVCVAIFAEAHKEGQRNGIIRG